MLVFIAFTQSHHNPSMEESRGKMKFSRLLPALAVAALLAACSSASDENGGASGSGMGSGSTGGMGSSSSSSNMNGPAPGSAEEFMTVVGDRVFFGLDKYTLSAEAQAVLRNQSAWLKRYGNRSLVIEGHADERGTREYNLALGERRASSVRDFLVAQGVAPQRLRVVSYGKERPACGQSTEECWSMNRRGVSVLQ